MTKDEAFNELTILVNFARRTLDNTNQVVIDASQVANDLETAIAALEAMREDVGQ